MADKDFVVKNGLIVGDTATINGVQIDPYGATSGQVLKFDGTKFAPATNNDSLTAPTYAETIGDGTNSTYVVTHNLNTKDVAVLIRDANSPYDVVQARWEVTTDNSITIDFSTIISSSSRRVFIACAGSLDYYVATIGDGSLTTINLDHNLGSRDVFVTVRNASSPYELISVGASATTLKRVTLDFSSAPEANSMVASVYLPSSGLSYSSKVGDGSTATFTLTHNLNTRDIGVIVRSVTSPYDFIPVRWEASTANTATIYFESTPTTDSRRVTVFSGVGGIKDFNDEVGLSDLEGVVLTSPSSGQFLSWNGTNWVNASAPGAISNTDSLTEGTTNLYFSNTRARSAISVSGDLAYNSSTGVISFTNDTGDIESVTAGTGLSGGGSSGSVTLSLASTTVSAGTYGNSSAVATFTVDAQGRLTSASNSSISIAASQISDLSSNTVVSIAGTANEVEVSGSTGSVTIGLPANVTISQDLVVTGNLTVSGNTTTINTETLLIEDNIIVLNSGHTGSPTTNAGVMVERGTSTDVEIRWNETSDIWEFTNDGTNYYPISNVSSANTTFTGTITLPGTTSIGTVSNTEISYLDGVTSNIQSQLDAKQKMIPYAATAPVSPTQGDLWVDSTLPVIKVYTGSSWVALGGVADDDQPILAARIFS